MHAMADDDQEQAMADEEIVTGRLQRNGKPIARKITAAIREGKAISFLFPLKQIQVGDTLRLLIPPDRVIDFEIVHKHLALGQDGETVDGRITSDDHA
jgi:hypothetical protein